MTMEFNEEKLWFAVLQRAVQDALSGEIEPELQQEAITWLTQPNEDFDAVCENAGKEPVHVRKAILRRLAEHQPQPKPSKHIITHNGESRTVTEWAAHLGMSKATIFNRLRAGWPLERVLTAPHRNTRRSDRQGRPAHLYTHLGKSLTIAEWALETGMSERTIRNRLYRHKCPIEQALQPQAAKPPKQLRPNRPVHIARRITHDGKSLTIAEWSQATGIARSTIQLRLAKGHAIQDVLAPSNRVKLTHGSQTLSIPAWSKIVGMSIVTLTKRHKQGWSVERILTEPVCPPGLRKKAKEITFQGSTRSVSLWAAELGLSKAALWKRLRDGWTLEQALGTPRQSHQARRRGAGSDFQENSGTGGGCLAHDFPELEISTGKEPI
jgi:AraC-like DNA-binding protein